jgi:hypothetical protein
MNISLPGNTCGISGGGGGRSTGIPGDYSFVASVSCRSALLDTGVGVGIVLRALADCFAPGAEIHGLRRSEMISLAPARRRQPHLTLHIAILSSSAVRGRQFGIIQSEYDWNHCIERGSIARGARVLAPDGCFALIDIDPPIDDCCFVGVTACCAASSALDRARGYFSILHAPLFPAVELLDQVGLTDVYRERRASDNW